MEFNTKISILLIIIIAILSINLLTDFTTKQKIAAYDVSSLKCTFGKDLNPIPKELCCQELQKQLTCERINHEEFSFKCHVSKTSDNFYLTTKEMLEYCKEEGYHVPIK